MGAFSPVYDGTIEMPAVPDDFAELIARRVESGLLVPGSRRRANYVVRSKSHDAVAFSAVGFLTQYAIGLNEVELRRAGPKRVEYQGSFWRWTLYAAVHALGLAIVILLGLLLWPGASAQISSYSWGWLYVGAMFVLFGLVWPWLLVAIHRRVVPRTLERIVRETLAT
jgi:hypothetical protein